MSDLPSVVTASLSVVAALSFTGLYIYLAMRYITPGKHVETVEGYVKSLRHYEKPVPFIIGRVYFIELIPTTEAVIIEADGREHNVTLYGKKPEFHSRVRIAIDRKEFLGFQWQNVSLAA